MNNIRMAISMLLSHDLAEEAEKLDGIAQSCECIDCKAYREAASQPVNTADGNDAWPREELTPEEYIRRGLTRR